MRFISIAIAYTRAGESAGIAMRDAPRPAPANPEPVLRHRTARWVARTMPFIAIVGVRLFFACSTAMAQSPKAVPPVGCPLNIAVQKIDEFEVNRMAEYAKNSQLLLNAMNKLVDEKANKPGASIGQQLSPQDLTKFNQLRRALALNGAEAMMVSNFQCDVHVIAET